MVLIQSKCSTHVWIKEKTNFPMLVAEEESRTQSLNPRGLFESPSLEVDNITSACMLGDHSSFLLLCRKKKNLKAEPSHISVWRNKQTLACFSWHWLVVLHQMVTNLDWVCPKEYCRGLAYRIRQVIISMWRSCLPFRLDFGGWELVSVLLTTYKAKLEP